MDLYFIITYIIYIINNNLYDFKREKVKAHYHRPDTHYWILNVCSKEIALKS